MKTAVRSARFSSSKLRGTSRFSLQTALLFASLLFNCVLIYISFESCLPKPLPASAAIEAHISREKPVPLEEEAIPVIPRRKHSNSLPSNALELDSILDPHNFLGLQHHGDDTDNNAALSAVVVSDKDAREGIVADRRKSKKSGRPRTILHSGFDDKFKSPMKEDNYREVTLGSPAVRSLHSVSSMGTAASVTLTHGEQKQWFQNHLFHLPDHNTAFCVIEKNSCTMFKQIFKRVRGKQDWKSTDYTKVHWLPYRGLEDISFRSIEKTAELMNDDSLYLAAFLRDPLERLVSGYIDKCDKKRGVNLCDYARWGDQWRTKHRGEQFSNSKSFTPPFQEWADGLLQCPCWPETDKHFAPQHLFCNLWQYADQFDLFRFENRTHRKVWMERAGIYEKYGSNGWGSGGEQGSIDTFSPGSHSSTNANRDTNKYIPYYEQNSTVTALLLDAYRSDYSLFGLQVPDWMCSDRIQKTEHLKRALRSLPRTSRPPCHELNWLWVAP